MWWFINLPPKLCSQVHAAFVEPSPIPSESVCWEWSLVAMCGCPGFTTPVVGDVVCLYHLDQLCDSRCFPLHFYSGCVCSTHWCGLHVTHITVYSLHCLPLPSVSGFTSHADHFGENVLTSYHKGLHQLKKLFCNWWRHSWSIVWQSYCPTIALFCYVFRSRMVYPCLCSSNEPLRHHCVSRLRIWQIMPSITLPTR